MFVIPQVIHTDQGKSFLSKVIKDLNKMLGIDHTLSPIYHPQSNGGCERLNRTLIEIVDWNIRLRDLWKKAPTVSIKAPEADSIIKSQLWAGLWSHEVKNSSRHQHDDHQVTSTQLLVYLRSIIDADTPVGERSALLVKDPHHTEMEELRNELKELKLLLQKKTASPPPYMGPSHGQPMRPHTPQPIRPFMGQPGNQQMMQPTHQPGPPMSHQMRQPSNQQMRGTRPTCYKCGKVGHVQRWCRVPQDRITPTTRDGNQTVGIGLASSIFHSYECSCITFHA